MVDVKNQADGMIHAVNKTLKDVGDKVSAEDRKAAEDAITALKEVLKSDDKGLIEAKLKVLSDASAKISEKLYATPGAEQSAQPEASQPSGGDANTVDAEFEEVKDDKK
jgi:molecular chaperone DnaK